jgi:hypothetical protein
VVHSNPLFPEAGEVKQEVMPKFSLEDFESECKSETNGIMLICKFLDTDLTFTGSKTLPLCIPKSLTMFVGEDVLKQKFAPKKISDPSIPEAAEHGQCSHASARIKADIPPGVKDWKMKHLPDPQGHYNMVIDLFNLKEIPVVVPNVRDADGVLIHPVEYSKKQMAGMPVAVKVIMWL